MNANQGMTVNRHTSRRIAGWAACLPAAVLTVGTLSGGPRVASAADNGPTQAGQICMQKIFGTPVANSNKVNCTANDIRLSRAIMVSPDTCTRGTTFNLTATFETIVTANARYDAGFFFRIDGGANARGDGSGATGLCSLSGLTIPPPPNPPALNLDSDTCGDLNSGTYQVTFTIPGVLCQDTDGDGNLNLPNCTSWHSNASTPCGIASPSTFNPDTKSKCVCDDTFQVPVRVEDATITVTKSASPTQVPEPGGTVTYTVSIKNEAAVESVTIKTIIDDLYGNLGTNTPALTDNTCPNLVNLVLTAGGTASCSFKAMATGDSGQRVTDTVTVCALQPSNNRQVCDDDSADVDITDVFTKPTLSKTAQATENCQLDATFQVVVSNNSEFDTLTINSLTDDKFGNLATTHAAGAGVGQVVSTTCSLPQPPIAALGNFTCSFVGRILSPSCSFDHENKATANVTDDDDVTSTAGDTATVSVTTTP